MSMIKRARRIFCVFEKNEGRRTYQGRYMAFIIGAIVIDCDKASPSFQQDNDRGRWGLLFLRWDRDSGALRWDCDRGGWDLLFLRQDFFLWRDHDSGALQHWDLLFL
jgi:hypothetical protein